MAVFADNPVLTHQWHAVARSADVAGGPLARRLLGRDIVIYRGPDGERYELRAARTREGWRLSRVQAHPIWEAA